MDAQDLKNSILQLAIQGKLVEHREEEGTGQELLEHIEREKTQLIKRKVIKRKKKLPKITEEEKEYDIPVSWNWASLEQITYNIGNKSNQIKQREILQEGHYPVISQSMNEIEGYSNQESKLLKVEPSSVIVFGDHSKTLKLIDFDFIIGADGTKILVPISMNPEYLYYVLNYNIINMRDRGYSRHFQFLKEKLIPVPPLKEQKRIVAKIEELLPYVDKYNAAYSEVEELNDKFPEDMQKSILQYAVQGKLVEQREEDGTAEDLFNQIQEEKKQLIKEGTIKKTKNLPEITEDEIPFDIPESWRWVRLGDICKSIADGDHQAPPQVSSGVPFLVISNISAGEIDFSNTRYVPKDYFAKLSPERVAEKSDLLFTVTGSYGITVKVEYDTLFCFQRHMALLKPLINVDFLLFLLKSPIVKGQCDIVATGTAQKTVGLTSLRNIIVPLPPSLEQKRIVEKIQVLMPFVDNLNKSEYI